MFSRRWCCLIFLLLPLPGCALTARSDLALMGVPPTQYTEQATIKAVFLDPANVSATCMSVQLRFGKAPVPSHACTFAEAGGPVTMVLPVPGTLPDDVFGALVAHEYQHVGQFIEGRPVDHHGWH